MNAPDKITPAEHARLSPSGSKRWFACAGSIVLEAPYPNKTNEYSDEGTACHEVAAWALTTGKRPAERTGEYINVASKREEPRFVRFTEALVDMVTTEVDTMRALMEGAIATFIEHRVDISALVGVPDQFGTLDVGIVTADGELQVRDFKFGHTPVDVTENTQLLIYAAGLYEEVSLAYEITGIRLGIHQPRAAGLTEWTCPATWLTGEFIPLLQEKVKRVEAATRDYPTMPGATWEVEYLNPKPNERDCAWCKAMASCPAYTREVQEAIGASFDVIAATPDLQSIIDRGARSRTVRMKAVPMVEDWCKAQRAEMESHLLAGGTDPEFGLELGRQGPRKWKDPNEVERLMREQMRLRKDVAYDWEIKSPTAMEKLSKTPGEDGKPILGPQQWKKLQPLIMRSDPKPSVKLLKSIKTPYTVPKPDAADFSAVEDDLN